MARPPVNSCILTRWRRPRKLSSMPWWTSPCRRIRSPTPASLRMSTVPCSSTPALTRLSTYSRLRVSITMDSTPCNHNRRPSSNPAGPAPTIPTCVRMAPSENSGEWGVGNGEWGFLHFPLPIPHSPLFRLQLSHPFIMRPVRLIDRSEERRRDGGSQDDCNRKRPSDHISIVEHSIVEEARQKRPYRLASEADSEEEQRGNLSPQLIRDYQLQRGVGATDRQRQKELRGNHQSQQPHRIGHAHRQSEKDASPDGGDYSDFERSFVNPSSDPAVAELTAGIHSNNPHRQYHHAQRQSDRRPFPFVDATEVGWRPGENRVIARGLRRQRHACAGHRPPARPDFAQRFTEAKARNLSLGRPQQVAA